ncbi:MAG: DJ-1/PfpI family protein [Candidatus Riflebacteria bacterium]|nr:DJ-1/PfpI family protein [Candidatus Riflebacteria bacterium]
MSRQKVALVIAPENFRDEELMVPMTTLNKAGFDTMIASSNTGSAKGMLGKVVIVQETIEKLSADDLAGLIVVGGSGSPKHLWDNKSLLDLISKIYKQGKPVGAICISPPVLGRAGILKNKKVTVWKDEGAIADLKKNGAEYIGGECVVDGLIVTADGPTSAERFAGEMLKLLTSIR